MANVAPYSKYNGNNLLLRKEDPPLLGKKVSHVLCGRDVYPALGVEVLWLYIPILTSSKKLEPCPCI